MNSRNRKFVVVTAVDVNKKEVTKVTEVSEDWLHEINVVSNTLKKDNKVSAILEVLASPLSQFEKCMPESYVKLHTIKEIRILAIIGEINLL